MENILLTSLWSPSHPPSVPSPNSAESEKIFERQEPSIQPADDCRRFEKARKQKWPFLFLLLLPLPPATQRVRGGGKGREVVGLGFFVAVDPLSSFLVLYYSLMMHSIFFLGHKKSNDGKAISAFRPSSPLPSSLGRCCNQRSRRRRRRREAESDGRVACTGERTVRESTCFFQTPCQKGRLFL